MKFPLLTHPKTREPDVMLTLNVIIVTSVTLKFLAEGIALHAFGTTFHFGHADAMTYAAMLSPVLGSHAVKEYSVNSSRADRGSGTIDNPDGN